jgi:hypothetical protein
MTRKASNEPHAKRHGWLKNGNPTGDPGNAPRCGAISRKGTPCKSPAMLNGRCRMHGGTSTGPRTEAGLARSRRANWKHGQYSAKTKQEAKLLHQFLREGRAQFGQAIVGALHHSTTRGGGDDKKS